MTSIWNATFWRATAERVLWTAVQAAVPAFTVSGITDVDWPAALSITLAAALLALLKTVGAGLATGSPGTGTAEVLAEPGQVGESSDAGPVEVVDLTDASDPSRDVSRLDQWDGVGRHREDQS